MEASVTEAGTRQEWQAGVEMLSRQSSRPGQTVGADEGYDVASLVAPCREMAITPHVAARRKGSRIDARTSRHDGYAISQLKRKQVEQPFGWMKTYGLLRKLRHRGRENVEWLFRFTATAYNITRLQGLMA